MGLGAFFGPRDARLWHREPEMMVVGAGWRRRRARPAPARRRAGVAGRAGAGAAPGRGATTRSRRLCATPAAAPGCARAEAERPREEARWHLLLLAAARFLCVRGSMRAARVVRAPIDACRARHRGFVALLCSSSGAN